MPSTRGRTTLARRRTAAAVGAALLLSLPALLPGTAAAAAPAGQAPDVGLRPLAPVAAGDYVTRPDIAAEAPELTTTTTGDTAPGLLMTTIGRLGGTYAAAIHRDDGDLVWWRGADDGGNYMDLEPVTFHGEPALAVFHGLYGAEDPGQARYEILDTAYRTVASFSVSGAAVTDTHDIEISPDGTRVLLLGVREATCDLTEFGGPVDGTVIDYVVQELDVDTGDVTFEWSFVDHVPLTESQHDYPGTDPAGRFDAYHTNSVSYDHDGDLLVSARHTSTVYKIDRSTGDIRWRFGGKHSDFTFADPADRPSYQHDARRQSDGRLSVFDNGNRRDPQYSRGAVYELDERAMTARLVADLRPDQPVYGEAMGSTRETANGNQLVSYGNTGRIVEFAGTEPVLDATIGDRQITYRAERGTWHATPDTPPDAVLRDGTIHMSWNGATEVASWRVAAGPSEDDLTTLGTVERTGFETAAEVTAPADAAVYRVTALDAAGDPLGSRTITP